MEKAINTTAYSLLGLLAKRDWTAAELARFMEHSVIRYILPRTRSQLFSEPKRLVKQGLAQALPAADGAARGTRYRITAEGRKALAEWLAAPGEPARLEHKSLLKFYLGDYRDHRALRLRVQEMRAQVLDEARAALGLVDDILDRGVVLPQTAVAASLASGLGVNQYWAQLEWLQGLEAVLEELPGEEGAADWALDRYRLSQRALQRLLRKYGESDQGAG